MAPTIDATKTQPASQPGSAGLPGAMSTPEHMLARWKTARLAKAGRIDKLARYLADADWRVRRRAGAALAAAGEKAIPVLVETMSNSKSAAARLEAVIALGEIATAAVVGPLLDALGDEEGMVRREAATILEELGVIDEDTLFQALSDERWWVRKAAAWALGAHGARAVEPLVGTLNDEDRGVRRSAAWSLGRIGSPKSVSPLVESLRDEDPSVRAAAAWALGKLGRASLASLLEALSDYEWWVRRAAAWALGELGDRGAIPALLSALSDHDSRVRVAVVWSLGAIQSEEALIPLLRSFEDPDPKVRREAVLALGSLQAPPGRIESVLAAAFSDRSAIVRNAAAVAEERRLRRAPRALQES
jgi:HEAT repeat protein